MKVPQGLIVVPAVVEKKGVHFHSALDDQFAAELLETLREEGRTEPSDLEPSQEIRPTAEQKALAQRLAQIVDARAASLDVSAEILAPRGDLKALALGRRDVHATTGWRRAEIGEELLAACRP